MLGDAPGLTPSTPCSSSASGVTGQAVGRALAAARRRRCSRSRTVPPRTPPRARRRRSAWGSPRRPTPRTLRRLLAGGRGRSCPAPACPTAIPCSPLAAAAGRPGAAREFDLAAEWDDRPVLAVTGTNGKTTVTHAGHRDARGVRSGRVAAAGNIETPLVEAIDDPDLEVFVVEAVVVPPRPHPPLRARGRRLAQLRPRPPRRARRPRRLRGGQGPDLGRPGPDDVAVVNADDPVVAGHATAAARRP